MEVSVRCAFHAVVLAINQKGALIEPELRRVLLRMKKRENALQPRSNNNRKTRFLGLRSLLHEKGKITKWFGKTQPKIFLWDRLF